MARDCIILFSSTPLPRRTKSINQSPPQCLGGSENSRTQNMSSKRGCAKDEGMKGRQEWRADIGALNKALFCCASAWHIGALATFAVAHVISPGVPPLAKQVLMWGCGI